VRRKKDISHFLVDLRKVRPILKGNDLKRLGLPQGPLYTKILNELRDERLRGKIVAEEDEEAYVRKHYPASQNNP
jgi:tRNA nucleotidyltransferase (CCA-adding enzyme)